MKLTPLEYIATCYPNVKDHEALRKIVGRYGITGKQQVSFYECFCVKVFVYKKVGKNVKLLPHHWKATGICFLQNLQSHKKDITKTNQICLLKLIK